MPTSLSNRVADFLWKLWYPFLTRLSKDEPVVFLNYGYAGDGEVDKPPLLKEEDEADRPCIQLYHRVVGGIDLAERDVLEVSCGHGGGASYVASYLRPKSMRGVDRNARAVELCRTRHKPEGLTFSCGNALALPFEGETFDAVINVEASHCYPDVPLFFSEVRRVLRPGGDFLYADFRDSGSPRALLHTQLEASGLEILSCTDISASVVRGMQLNTEKYVQLVQRLVPRILRRPALAFAGVKGSAIYQALESRKTVYLCYHLRKPARP